MLREFFNICLVKIREKSNCNLLKNYQSMEDITQHIADKKGLLADKKGLLADKKGFLAYKRVPLNRI